MQIQITLDATKGPQSVVEQLNTLAAMLSVPAAAKPATAQGVKAAVDDFDAEETAPEIETAAAVDVDDFDLEPEKAKPAKAKPAKVTRAEVNDQCKAHAKKHGREATLKVLKTAFKTTSINDLDEKQYAAAIKALAV